jgi:hypothetical protein
MHLAHYYPNPREEPPMQQPVLQQQQQQSGQQQQQLSQQLQLQHQQLDQQPEHTQGRSLQQVAYGTYDPYAGGVTPGLVNVDVNGVTGTHFDAAGLAFDMSADQNYIGFSIGNIFGVGIARDRGYDIQIGGGNLADISVTKDAGIGLWLLNGLVNLNYMPGGGWSLGTVAAQGTISEAVAAGNATLANVMVDYPSSSSSNVAAPIPVIEVDGTTSSQVSTYYSDYGVVSSTGSGSSSSSYSSSYNSAAPAPASSSTYNTYSTQPSSSSMDSSSYLVSREATDYTDYSNLWSIESAYSDTAAMSAAAAAAGGGMYSNAASTSSSSSSSSSSNSSTRRACEGGTVVAVSGSKFTCRYKRSTLVRVASDVITYSNGIVA